MYEESPYDILGISRNASDQEIRRQYRKLVAQLHADVNKDPQAQVLLFKYNNAYDKIKNEEARKNYNNSESQIVAFFNKIISEFLKLFIIAFVIVIVIIIILYFSMSHYKKKLKKNTSTVKVKV